MKSELLQTFRSLRVQIFSQAALVTLISLHSAAFAERQKFSGRVKFLAPSITSLHGNKALPGPTVPVPDLKENMNQCAGTVQHYRLPASGYKPTRQSEVSRAGKLLYVKRNCASCHEAENTGGSLGPPLDGIGGARGEPFITAHLLDPEKQMLEFPVLFGGRSNIMPHLGIKVSEAKLITAYLLTLPEPQNGFLVVAHPKLATSGKQHVSETKVAELFKASDTNSIQKGRALFLSRGCAACHTLDGSQTRFGPRLDGVSLRRSQEEIEEALRSGNDEPEMISTLHFSKSEVHNLLDFLNSLPDGKQPKVNSDRSSMRPNRAVSKHSK